MSHSSITRGLARSAARPLTLGTVALALVGWGCTSEPQVASDVPPVAITPDADADAKAPKGKPKNTTAGLTIDPATGRPVSN